MFNRLRRKWYARQRELDKKILWPSILRNARNVNHAINAFTLHIYNDPAWTCLTSHERLAFLAYLREKHQ